ncbi:facilitated trehalose transporter Tret1-like isoform X2 [Hydra vulgaris]
MLFTALLGIGAVVGLMFAGFFVEHYGRKKGLVIAAIFYIAGWTLIYYLPNEIRTIFFGRILTGVATGFCSLTVSIYIAEVSPFQLRGRLGVINQIGFTIGIFYASLVNFLDDQMISAIAGLVISLIMGLLVLLIPESPRWLLTKKKRSEAMKSLLWLRGTLYNVEDECSEIENNLELQHVAAQNDFIKHDFYRPFLYSSLLEVFRQMCGIYPLIYFGHGLVKMAGLTDPFFVLLYIAHVLITVTMYFIVDKYKRRKLLMIGAFGMCICNILLGVYFHIFIEPENDRKALRYDLFIKDEEKLEPFKVKCNQNYSYLAFTCFLFFIICYSIGWGTIPTLFMSEIFPPRLRGFSCSFVLGVSWCFSFIVTISFFKLVIFFGIQVALWTFSVFCLISILFVYLFVPETKDKTLEDIEHYFQMNKQWLNYLY